MFESKDWNGRKREVSYVAQRARALILNPTAARMDPPLSPREREVLALVAEGLSSREIANRIRVARSTVQTQIRSAVRKLGATNRRHAAALAIESEDG
jgi:DNA-binding CsgD family transcriptional regulator